MRVYIDPSPSICQTNPAEKEEGAVRFLFFISFLALVNNSVNEPSILMSFSETSASNKKKTIFFPFTLTRRCGKNRDRDKKRQKSITDRTCPCLRYFLPIPKIIIKLYLISYVTFFFCFFLSTVRLPFACMGHRPVLFYKQRRSGELIKYRQEFH